MDFQVFVQDKHRGTRPWKIQLRQNEETSTHTADVICATPVEGEETSSNSC